MKVWLVMQNDGNVCCPASEVRAVCTTKGTAEAFIAANTSRDSQYVEEWFTDEYVSAG